MAPAASASHPHSLRLRYAGHCVGCGRPLPAGSWATYDPAPRTVTCPDCRPAPRAAAGGSAQREYQRRRGRRAERVKSIFGGFLGGVILTLVGDGQATAAWRRGAAGERRLARVLDGIPNVRALHDRAIPGSRANLDHVVVGPAGVAVIDAKRYRGLIHVEDRGGLFHRDLRLCVGRRDCSGLADAMPRQVEAVQRTLVGMGVDVPVTAYLCFVDGEWSIPWPPDRFHGVGIEGPRTIGRRLQHPRLLDPATVETIAAGLDRALRPR